MSQLVSSTGPAVRRMVAVWHDPGSGHLHVLPPCGRCREAVKTLGQGNRQALVILGPGPTVPPEELLPFHGRYAENAWPESEPSAPPRPER